MSTTSKPQETVSYSPDTPVFWLRAVEPAAPVAYPVRTVTVKHILLASALAAVAAAQGGGLFELHVESAAKGANARPWVLAGRAGPAETVYLDSEVLLDASAIASADAERGPDGSSQIRLSMTPEGAGRLADVTSRGVGRRLGIVAGGRLRSAPFLTAPVTNGVLVIAGGFSDSEAKELARKLGPPAARISTGGSGTPRGTSAASELEGAWKVMNSTMNGRLGDPKLTGSTWTFRVGELTVENGSGQTERFAVRMEAGAPRAFRLDPVPPSKEHGGWMIFSREGDRLTVAFGDNLAGRPENFAPEPKKVVMKLTRADRSAAAPAPCAILEAAGIGKLLPGAAARLDGRTDATSCSFSDPAGRGEVSLTVVRAAGRLAFEKEVKRIRKTPRGTVREDPDLAPAAISAREGYRAMHLVLQRETLVGVSYQLPGTDDARLREFTKRLLALLRD